MPKKEAKEWLLKERRFYYLTDLICAEDDLARALALQVLAIVRRNLGEGTVSDLLQNVIDHFAHLEFTKGGVDRAGRERTHTIHRQSRPNSLHEVPVGDRQATL